MLPFLLFLDIEAESQAVPTSPLKKKKNQQIVFLCFVCHQCVIFITCQFRVEVLEEKFVRHVGIRSLRLLL